MILPLTAIISIFIFNSCDTAGEKVYSRSFAGVCTEIITSDSDLQDAAERSGFTESVCPSLEKWGTCKDFSSFEGESYDAFFYYSGFYNVESAAYSCIADGKTWVEE